MGIFLVLILFIWVFYHVLNTKNNEDHDYYMRYPQGMRKRVFRVVKGRKPW